MSILIDKHIKSALAASEALQAKVSGRCYQVWDVSGKVPVFPYVVYAMDGTTEEYTKESVALGYGMSVSVSIDVVAKTASQMSEVAELVRKAMAAKADAEYDEFTVIDQSLTVGQEDYDLNEGAFFITLHYTIETAMADEETDNINN